VNNSAYAGHGVEIEDDIVRLRRRKLEYEGDAARRARRTQPRRLRAFFQRGQYRPSTTDGCGG